jgi:aldehyde dehydrogenase (NAD+)
MLHLPRGVAYEQDSGFGREGGMASIAEMSEVKWVTIQMGKREFPF